MWDVRCEWCVIYSELLYSELFYSERLYPELFYSERLYPELLYSELLYSELLFSDLLYSELLYISVIRIFGNQTSFDKRKLQLSCPSRTYCFWSVSIVSNVKIGHVNRHEHPRFFCRLSVQSKVESVTRTCFLRHVPWSRSDQLRRWCHHPQGWHGHHLWWVQGDAPSAQNQRSNWAQNPESWTASRLFNHEDGWCSGAGENKVVRGWSCSNSHLQKKRSGSCKQSWCADTGALSLEHSSWIENNFQVCFR